MRSAISLLDVSAARRPGPSRGAAWPQTLVVSQPDRPSPGGV